MLLSPPWGVHLSPLQAGLTDPSIKTVISQLDQVAEFPEVKVFSQNTGKCWCFNSTHRTRNSISLRKYDQALAGTSPLCKTESVRFLRNSFSRGKKKITQVQLEDVIIKMNLVG